LRIGRITSDQRLATSSCLPGSAPTITVRRIGVCGWPAGGGRSSLRRRFFFHEPAATLLGGSASARLLFRAAISRSGGPPAAVFRRSGLAGTPQRDTELEWFWVLNPTPWVPGTERVPRDDGSRRLSISLKTAQRRLMANAKGTSQHPVTMVLQQAAVPAVCADAPLQLPKVCPHRLPLRLTKRSSHAASSWRCWMSSNREELGALDLAPARSRDPEVSWRRREEPCQTVPTRPTGKSSELSILRVLGHESDSAGALARRRESGDLQAPS
jgi:hypothetical protein